MAVDDKAGDQVINTLQLLFQTAVQEPSNSSSASALAHIDQSSGLNIRQRLGIYQYGYSLRLLECMRAEYPLLATAFSPDWFDTMARHYLSTNPSISTNLNDLSSGFPAFLQRDRPDRDQLEKDKAYDFLINLAEFERAKIETSRGKGSEGSEVEQFLKIESSNLHLLKVHLAENVRVIKAKFDLLSYLKNATCENFNFVERDQYIVVCRENYHLSHFEVSDWQFDLVREFRCSSNVSKAIETVSQAYPSQPVYGLALIFLTQLAMNGALTVCSDDSMDAFIIS